MSADYWTTIGEVAQVFDGPHATPKKIEEGPYFLSISSLEKGALDLSKSAHVSEEDFVRWTKRVTPQEGDVLFSYETRLGDAAIMPAGIVACLGRRMGLLRPNTEKVIPEYLLYSYLSPTFQEVIRANTMYGATVNRIALKDMPNFPIWIPPLEEQGRVVAVLKPLDGKIELNRQTNQTLEHIAQALFKCWFVDFEPTRAKIIAKEKGANTAIQELAAQAIICGAMTLEKLEAITQNLETTLQQAINEKLSQANQTPINTEQLKTTAALFPDALVDSELGEIPEGWGVRVVGDIVTRLKPKKRYTKKQVGSFGNIPVFEQGSDILLGYHNEGSGFYASPEEPLFIFGDHTCVTHLACENFDISQNVIALEGNYYPTVWVYYAIQGKQVFQEYRRHWSEFIIKEVVAPSLELAKTYSELVTRLYKQKEQLVRENGTLVQTRDALLPKLLSGELVIDKVS